MRRSRQRASRTTRYGCLSWTLHNSRLLSNAQLLQLYLTALLRVLCLAKSYCSIKRSKLSTPGKHSPQAEKKVIEALLLTQAPESPEALK